MVDIDFMYLAWELFDGELGGLALPIALSWASSIPVAALLFLPLTIVLAIG